jgi:hypothetical protein
LPVSLTERQKDKRARLRSSHQDPSAKIARSSRYPECRQSPQYCDRTIGGAKRRTFSIRETHGHRFPAPAPSIFVDCPTPLSPERVSERNKQNTQNPKVLLRLASIYTKLGRSQDAFDTYALIQQVRGPSTPMPWLQRPTPIPREVPHITANFTAALAARSNPASEEVKQRYPAI